MFWDEFVSPTNNKTYLSLHEKDSTFYPILDKFGFSRQTFVKALHIKFHRNPSSGSRADTCGQTGGHHDVLGDFRDCVRAPKTCAGTTLSITELKWITLGSKPGYRYEKPATYS
jgi:hypothetical protein